MQPFEQLGLFYLGKRFSLDTRKRSEEPVLYDSKHLVTHAVCIGMTGSGKTGLGIGVIEEAVLDGIPVLAIDPKGDLANLALTFPDMTPADFEPWLAQGESARERAEAWRAGLAEWGQDPARVRRLRAAANVRVYTPGSRAGVPLAVLRSLSAAAERQDPETLAARVGAGADAVLALAGYGDVTPHSRERVLLATLLHHAAESGRPVDLTWLVQQVQRPAVTRVGVMDVETFYPARERQDLVLRLNGILASPGFDVWLSGDPPDIGRMLFTPDGQPRVAIVSIAHLADAERMLVTSLVLNEMLAWTRAQSGTSSLRALVYMDEVAGYLPPVATPPSKAPLLTLLKQARAFGVGIMLSTQNPVDLDYKALANTGTWFLGKLQTERDKARVLDGLEGLAGGLDRQGFDRLLSALGKRVFLLHDVHEREPIVFETRWTLSYLRGPMTKDDIRRITPAPDGAGDAAPRGTPREQTRSSRPVPEPGVREFFLPGAGAVYAPHLYASARVAYADKRRGVDTTEQVHALVAFGAGAIPVQWDAASRVDIAPASLLPAPAAAAARYESPPAAAMDAGSYKAWENDFARWVADTQRLRLFSAPRLELASRPGETERDFLIRLRQAWHEHRDAQVEKLRTKYAPRLVRLTDRAARAQEAVTRERQQADQQKVQTALSIGATMIGALLGRSALSTSTLGRATTAARGASRAAKEASDVSRAEERAADVQQELAALEAELQREIAAVPASFDEPLDVIEIKPARGGVDVQLVALVWQPVA